MDSIAITVAGRPVQVYLCERCGTKIYPREAFDRHVARHNLLNRLLTEILVCVDCGGAINAIQSGQRRCQRCTGRARARHRARLNGKSGRPKLNRALVNINQGSSKRAAK